MKRNWRTLLRPYKAALNRYLKPRSSGGLQSALKLGHRAVALKLETLDMALQFARTGAGKRATDGASTPGSP